MVFHRLFFCFILMSLVLPTMAMHEGYYNHPDIHGDRIVFTSEGDLWTVSALGGTATRLTRGAGAELMPKFSPDGKMIAFAGEYGGALNVYVMPSEGGTPTRLTWHPVAQIPSGWTPDGSAVLFTSASHNPHYDRETFQVPVTGGVPEKLPVGTASYLVMGNDGKTVAFNRNYVQPRTWKRYGGGLADDIWIGNIESGDFEQLTEYFGNDFAPHFVGDRIFFTSERDGRLNLWSMTQKGKELTQHTVYTDFDVRYPETDGEYRVVYQQGADIHLYDVTRGESWTVDIKLQSDLIQVQPRMVAATDFLTDLAISNDGKKAIISSRGELYNVPVESGRVRPITRNSPSRELMGAFAGKEEDRIVAMSDESGEWEIYTFDAKDGSSVEQVTHEDQEGRDYLTPFFPLHVSPDGEALAFADQMGTLYWTNLTTKTLHVVDQSKNWEIRDYQWSPNNRYLAYARPEARNIDRLYIYDTKTSETLAISDPMFDSYAPTWDPEGNYLYYVSERTFNRVNSAVDRESIMVDNAKIYAVPLRPDVPNPFVKGDPYDEEEEKKDDDEEWEIDYNSIATRAFEFPMDSGSYSYLHAANGKVFYWNWDGRSLSSIPVEPEPEASELASGLDDFAFSLDRSHIIYRKGSKVQVMESKAKGADSEDPSVLVSDIVLTVDPREEWRQIFHETYRYFRDFFYDPNHANQDWKAISDKYEPLLERISTRQELSAVQANMVADLGHGHTYILGDGDAPDGADRIPQGLLGVDFSVHPTSQTVVMEKIYRGERWNKDTHSPFQTPELMDLPDGAHLLKVNGVEVLPNRDPNSFFWGLAGKEVALTISSDGHPDNTKEYRVRLIGADNALRLYDFVDGNRRYVSEKSDGQLGYVYLPNMSSAGLVSFFREFYPQLDKKAMVIDVRWNGGGNVSSLIIRRLAAELYATMQARNFDNPSLYPQDVFLGPMAALINQRCGSDGDIFAHSFRHFDLGPLIGTRTWGGTIGINYRTKMIDGSGVAVPQFAFTSLKDGLEIENKGVSPDKGYEIDLSPSDQANGRDPQLDKAIEYLMKEMTKKKYQMPEHPEWLDRSVESFRERSKKYRDKP